MTDWSYSPYYYTAINAAQQYHVPSELFVQQIGQESSFNPNAVNGSAIGIAQFMPSTAAQFGIDPTNPTQSLYAAAQYDAQLHSQYGSWQSALQHYGTTASGNAPDINTLAGKYDNPDWLARQLLGIGDFIGNATKGAQYVADKATGAAKAAGDVASGVGTLLGIVTDLPRMATIIIGLIALVVGLAMLGQKPAVQIVNAAKKIMP